MVRGDILISRGIVLIDVERLRIQVVSRVRWCMYIAGGV